MLISEPCWLADLSLLKRSGLTLLFPLFVFFKLIWWSGTVITLYFSHTCIRAVFIFLTELVLIASAKLHAEAHLHFPK